MEMYCGDSKVTGESNVLMLRRSFLKFSSFLVSVPTKAFRFDKQQYLRMCKDTGLTKVIKLQFLDEIFSAGTLAFDIKAVKDPRRMWNSVETGKFCAAINKGGKVAKAAIAKRKAAITSKRVETEDPVC